MSFITDLVAKAQSILAEPPPPTETQAIHSNWYDRADFERTIEEIPAVRAEMEELDKTVDYVKEFMGDLHSTFYKVQPMLRGRDEVAPTHAVNRDIIETILDMPEVANLRQHSVADTYGTAMAMTAMQEVTLETVKRAQEAAEQAAQRKAEADAEADRSRQDIQALLEALAGTENEAAQEWLGEQLQERMDQFAQQQGQSQQAQQQIEQAGQTAAGGAQSQIRSAAKAADEQLTEEMELAAAFGTDPGELKQMPARERIELARKLQSNRLAEFVKLIGQFKAVQQAEARKRIINAASEVHGITQSAYLERMVAGEFLNFADPSLETLMWLRWTEHQLNTYDVRGKERQGQGPIICVVDESGSMGAADVAGGTREAWSKALSLAMLDQARRRNRDFVYIGFGSPGEIHIVKFPKGEANLEKVIQMTEHFFCGGTYYEGPLREALRIIETDFDDEGKGRPDIVFLSDDEYGRLDESFLEEYHRVKEKASIKTYGIAIGCSVGGAMKQLSDNVRAITELVSDPRNVGDLFRTI